VAFTRRVEFVASPALECRFHLTAESMVTYSGLQWRVLHLYRDLLRELRSKPADMQRDLKQFIRMEFEKRRGLSRLDVSTIEYFVRMGEKQLELLRSKNLTSFQCR
jgi:succinate dehydrogenase assembly factor 1